MSHSWEGEISGVDASGEWQCLTCGTEEREATIAGLVGRGARKQKLNGNSLIDDR